MTTRNYPENRKTSNLVRLAAARASAVRFHGADSDEAREAAAALRLAKIRALIGEEPPLREADRLELARVLLPDGWQLWEPVPDPAAELIRRVLG